MGNFLPTEWFDQKVKAHLLFPKDEEGDSEGVDKIGFLIGSTTAGFILLLDDSEVVCFYPWHMLQWMARFFQPDSGAVAP